MESSKYVHKRTIPNCAKVFSIHIEKLYLVNKKFDLNWTTVNCSKLGQKKNKSYTRYFHKDRMKNVPCFHKVENTLRPE